MLILGSFKYFLLRLFSVSITFCPVYLCKTIYHLNSDCPIVTEGMF